MMQGLFPYGFPSVMAGPLFSNGSIRNEIRAGQILPLSDRKADIAYEEIIVRRSNRFGFPLSQAQADVEWVAPPSRLLANSSHSANSLSNALASTRSSVSNPSEKPS